MKAKRSLPKIKKTKKGVKKTKKNIKLMFLIFLVLILFILILVYSLQNGENTSTIRSIANTLGIEGGETFDYIAEWNTSFSSSFVQDNFPNNCHWHTYARTLDGDTILTLFFADHYGINSSAGEKNVRLGRVRFPGLDAPETLLMLNNLNDTPPEKWGPEATKKLESMLNLSIKLTDNWGVSRGPFVCLIYDKTWGMFDGYNRHQAYIFIFNGSAGQGNGFQLALASNSYLEILSDYGNNIQEHEVIDISKELLTSGLAKGVYTRPFEREEEFREFEKIAKEKKIGVWE